MSIKTPSSRSSFASRYAKVLPLLEKYGLGQLRQELVGELHGSVLEIGAGTGVNLPHYPSDVDLTLTEPSLDMFEILSRNEDLGNARLFQVSATELADCEVGSARFDYLVSTLVLCSVADVASVLENLAKMMSPGGKYLFMEHGASPGLYGTIQKIATPIWSRISGNCHLDRDLLQQFDDSPFVVTNLRFFRFPFGRPLVPYGFIGTAQLKSDFSL